MDIINGLNLKKHFLELDIIDSIMASKDDPLTRKSDTIFFYPKETDVFKFSLLDFNKYYEIIKNHILVEKMEYKYFQRPKLYCFDKYGSIELFDIIMYINSCMRTENFRFETVRYITKEGITKLIKKINPKIFIDKELDEFKEISVQKEA